MNENELRGLSRVRVLFHIRGHGPGGWDPVIKVGKIRWVNKKTVGIDLDKSFYGKTFFKLRHERVIGGERILNGQTNEH
jgi:hypothetical protein